MKHLSSLSIIALLATSAAAEVPSPLKGLREMRDRINKRLDEMQGNVSSRDVVFARIDVTSYFGNLYRGGTNAGECPECMKHPLFAELKAAFPAMEARMERLEHDQGCTYGLQIDGKILKLTTKWSREEWNSLLDKAKHKQARCWMDNDKESYL